MNEEFKQLKQVLERFNLEFGKCALYVSSACCACGLDRETERERVVAVLHPHKVSGLDFEYACVGVCQGCVTYKESIKRNVVGYVQREDLEAIII